MIRAVLDANVYVSAIIHPGGTPGRIVERFLREASFQLVVSPAIVEEVLRALAYRKVRKLLGALDGQLWFEDLVVLADVVADTGRASGVCDDADDDKYLAAALEGRATHVVTGDQRFLAVREHLGVAIVTPRAFFDPLAR